MGNTVFTDFLNNIS